VGTSKRAREAFGGYGDPGNAVVISQCGTTVDDTSCIFFVFLLRSDAKLRGKVYAQGQCPFCAAHLRFQVHVLLLSLFFFLLRGEGHLLRPSGASLVMVFFFKGR